MKYCANIVHNSTYVHQHLCGTSRAERRCGAPLRHMALRPGLAPGHVTYVQFVMHNVILSAQDMGNTFALRNK
jgi:hypothetical protein